MIGPALLRETGGRQEILTRKPYTETPLSETPMQQSRRPDLPPPPDAAHLRKHGDQLERAIEACTLVLNKPAGVASDDWQASLAPQSQWDEDRSGPALSDRQLQYQTVLMPLETEASGLLVLSQDERVRRRLRDDRTSIEQEFVVSTSGTLAPYGMHRLMRGLSFLGRPLPNAKVSWQNETHLRFAMKDVQPGQIRFMCEAVDLQVLSIRRIRIGRVPMRKMPAGQWRYLPAHEHF